MSFDQYDLITAVLPKATRPGENARDMLSHFFEAVVCSCMSVVFFLIGNREGHTTTHPYISFRNHCYFSGLGHREVSDDAQTISGTASNSSDSDKSSSATTPTSTTETSSGSGSTISMDTVVTSDWDETSADQAQPDETPHKQKKSRKRSAPSGGVVCFFSYDTWTTNGKVNMIYP